RIETCCRVRPSCRVGRPRPAGWFWVALPVAARVRAAAPAAAVWRNSLRVLSEGFMSCVLREKGPVPCEGAARRAPAQAIVGRAEGRGRGVEPMGPHPSPAHKPGAPATGRPVAGAPGLWAAVLFRWTACGRHAAERDCSGADGTDPACVLHFHLPH